ncbi:putative Protein COBRA [Zostera marina]|uniref:COBRA C-terminal domain-containing protein n=1 Tax=Zostera marina TaxID=29655 RepID=A0A0K9P2C0_ZOSMR|nr:putative Protein COBRA [Zostera marina]
MGYSENHIFRHIRLTTTVVFLILFPLCTYQQQTLPSQSPRDLCNGVFLEYKAGVRSIIHPMFPDEPARQPYRFEAVASVYNGDSIPVEQWILDLEYPNETVIVSASNVVITDGSAFPYIVGENGSVGISFYGSPNSDLKTAIETAGDINQIQAKIDIVGTQFGDSPPAEVLPNNMKLDNKKFICDKKLLVRDTVSPPAVPKNMHICCTRDPKFNDTSPISDDFLPRQTGDLTIAYDVLQSFGDSYIAQVKIEMSKNNDTFVRLDNWRLSWRWMQGEFIQRTQGAYTTIVNPRKCLFGVQGKFYKDFDFNKVQNCDTEPTFLDLPVSMTNDTQLGRIPFCCRNGTILPAVMDPAQSVSAFQLQVQKMPPYLNRTDLTPPLAWNISGSNGAFNPKYECGPPIKVSPSLFPDSSGLPSSSSAISSWQVVCNVSKPANSKPRCCVSFSGFYNESVVPCPTCACGCPNVKDTCSTRSPAMLLPSEALLVPFDNRTEKAVAWAEMKHYNIPNPLPCSDGCGVSINWHVFTDFRNGWSAKMTIFNWGETDIPDWFASVVMDKAYSGYEVFYSFNGTDVGNNTIFVRGLEGLNYLIKEDTTKDPNDPGKLQSVVSFNKKLTPGINVVAGDGFPTKVFFNGEECSIPSIFPTSDGSRISAAGTTTFFLVLLGLLFV